MITKIKFTVLMNALLFVLWGTIHGAGKESVAYHDYKSMTQILKDISKKHSAIMKLESQGTTLGDREIWSVTLSADETQQHPAVLIVGGVEGADLIASEICVQFIQSIVANYAKSDSIRKLLHETTFYIFPRVNPDAAEAFFMKPQYERFLNARSLDLDKDGLFDEDVYEDLNGDGVITMMRVVDPAGELMPDNDIPDLLRPSDHIRGDKQVYQILTEGRDNDGDGMWNEDESGGVNFNNNFTYNYSYFVSGSGTHQISEAETRAVADFAFAHPNIAVVFSFSPNENLMQPWKSQPQQKSGSGRIITPRNQRVSIDEVLFEDAPYFNHIADQFKKITRLSHAPQSVKGQGAFSEWAYYHFGRWSFSARGWWPPVINSGNEKSSLAISEQDTTNENAIPEKPSPKFDPLAEKRQLWTWIQATAQKNAIIPWTSISHPDFPNQKVEIGGFKPFVGINPPADSIPNQAQRYTKFLLYVGSLLPKIEIAKLTVTNLHTDTYRIELTILNKGYFPTNTELGMRSKWNPRIKVTVDMDKDHRLLSGRKQDLIDVIPGNGASKELRWLIKGKQGSYVTVRIGSPITGTIEQRIELK